VVEAEECKQLAKLAAVEATKELLSWLVRYRIHLKVVDLVDIPSKLLEVEIALLEGQPALVTKIEHL
jgi:hypothetical protein